MYHSEGPVNMFRECSSDDPRQPIDRLDPAHLDPPRPTCALLSVCLTPIRLWMLRGACTPSECSNIKKYFMSPASSYRTILFRRFANLEWCLLKLVNVDRRIGKKQRSTTSLFLGIYNAIAYFNPDAKPMGFTSLDCQQKDSHASPSRSPITIAAYDENQFLTAY